MVISNHSSNAEPDEECDEDVKRMECKGNNTNKNGCFICPISMTPLKKKNEILKTPNGGCYHKEHLCHWLNTNNIDPLTNTPITDEWKNQHCPQQQQQQPQQFQNQDNFQPGPVGDFARMVRREIPVGPLPVNPGRRPIRAERNGGPRRLVVRPMPRRPRGLCNGVGCGIMGKKKKSTKQKSTKQKSTKKNSTKKSRK